MSHREFMMCCVFLLFVLFMVSSILRELTKTRRRKRQYTRLAVASFVSIVATVFFESSSPYATMVKKWVSAVLFN